MKYANEGLTQVYIRDFVQYASRCVRLAYRGKRFQAGRLYELASKVYGELKILSHAEARSHSPLIPGSLAHREAIILRKRAHTMIIALYNALEQCE